MKIGVFDSGIGGLSVLHCAGKMIPGVDFIYYADEEHVPYGEKRPEQLRGYIKEIFDFMLNRDVDAIVIACNTATTIVDKEYRKQFPVPIIGMEPAVKRATDLYEKENKRILVAATPITIHGNKLHHLVEQVDDHELVDLVALPGLVRFAENGVFHSKEVVEYLKKELESYDLSSYGTVVLGCTHFNYFKESFQDVFRDSVHFVDGNEGTIHQLMRLLSIPDHCEGNGTIEYYFSGKKVNTTQMKQIENYFRQLDQVLVIQ